MTAARRGGTIPAAALVALAVAIATLRRAVLPRAWGWVSVAAAVVFASSGTVWASDGFWAPHGAWATIAFLLFLAWPLVTSIVLVLRSEVVAAGVPPAAPAH